MLIVQKADELLRYAEMLVTIGRKATEQVTTSTDPQLHVAHHRVVRLGSRHVAFTPLSVFRGLKQAARGAVVWYVSFVGLSLFLALGQPAWPAVPDSPVLVWVILLVPVGYALFPAPSTHSGFPNPEDVAMAHAFLLDLDVIEQAELEAVRDKLADAEEQSRQRVNTLKWFSGVLWTIVVSLAGLYFTASFNASPTSLEARGYMNLMLAGAGVTLLWLLILQSYSATTTRIYRTIKSAIRQLSVDLQRTSSTNPHLDAFEEARSLEDAR